MNISVVMATYNGAAFIKEQIDSILSQLPDDSELIISDDGSTDNTIAIIKAYKDPCIRLIQNQQKKGAIGNFENGLQQASGDFIFLADQDDIWLPDKVNTCLQYLTNCDMVVADCSIVNQQLEVIQPSMFSLYQSRPGLIPNFIRNRYVGCCMAFRKDILAIALPFPKHIPQHDIWLGFVTDLFYTSCFIPQKLILYRRHMGNASVTSQKSPFSLGKKLQFRFNTIRYLPLLLIRKNKHRQS